MARKRYRPEEIIAKLREAEAPLSQGAKTSAAIKQLGIHEVTYYRWRNEYGGMRVDQMKRLKELVKENSRLRKVTRPGFSGRRMPCTRLPQAGLVTTLPKVIGSSGKNYAEGGDHKRVALSDRQPQEPYPDRRQKGHFSAGNLWWMASPEP